MQFRSYPRSTTTPAGGRYRHRATTSTKTVLLGLLVAAPSVWLHVPGVNAAPASGVTSLDVITSTNKHLETKRLLNNSSNALVGKRDNGTTRADDNTSYEDGGDPWLMPSDKFYDHYMDEFWTRREQSSAQGRSSLVGLAERNMKKRTVPKYDGALYCSVFSTGYMETVSSLLWDSHKKHNIIEYIIGWRECRRLACKDTSGVYVCNDTTQVVRVTGERVYTLGKIPNDNCCHQGAKNTPTKKAGHGISGQKFSGTGFNVIIGYANCNLKENVRPSKGAPDNPWGPNLECVTEFFGQSPSQTNDDVAKPMPGKKKKKRGETVVVVEEPEWELVDDGMGIFDLVEKKGEEKKKRELVKVDEEEARLMRMYDG